MAYGTILVDESGGIVTLTFNRPDRLEEAAGARRKADFKAK